MLTVESLNKEFATPRGSLRVLHDVSLSMEAGQSAAIMGPSGSGKSTLLNIIGTLEAPTNGSVRIDGQDPFALDDRQLAAFRNRTIGFVFQEHHLLPQLCVLENVLMPTLAGSGNGDAASRATELLDKVGLSDRLDHRPSELSGGERQRVAIARSLINEPRVLLADEPTGNLDRATAEGVADLLLEIHRDARTVLITVTHSDDLARRFDSRWSLLDGELRRS